MVAINLLKGPQPSPARRCALSEVLVGLFALAGTCSVWGWVVVDGNHVVQRLEQERQERQEHLASMKKPHDRMLALNEQRKTILAEQQQHAALTDDPNRPIRLLSVLSQAVDPLDVWLRHLQTKDKTVVLSGFALSREAVLTLAKQLEETPGLGPVTAFEMQADAAQPARVRLSMNMDAGDHG